MITPKDVLAFPELKVKKINWLEKICLWFSQTYIIIDEYKVAHHYKIFRGRLYLVKEESIFIESDKKSA